MNTGRLITAAIAIMASSMLLKFGNENYEALKAEFGLAAPIACLIGGGGLIYFGIKSLARAFAR